MLKFKQELEAGLKLKNINNITFKNNIILFESFEIIKNKYIKTSWSLEDNKLLKTKKEIFYNLENFLKNEKE